VDSEHSEEGRGLVRELLGGHGTVFTRNGRIGARFESAGLLDMAEMSYKSMIYNFGSGGMIRNYRRPDYRKNSACHEIFF
jgi:hypothetical protein